MALVAVRSSTTLEDPMFLIKRRAFLAPFVLLIGAGLLEGCARASVRPEPLDTSRIRAESLRFDNEGRDRLDIYLVGEKRSWRLGRLEPGATRWLRVPSDIPPNDLARMQLVVLANAEVTVAPMRDPRAVTTIRQPVFVMAAQRWAFADGQLKGVRAR